MAKKVSHMQCVTTSLQEGGKSGQHKGKAAEKRKHTLPVRMLLSM